jgi:hypothetical protein
MGYRKGSGEALGQHFSQSAFQVFVLAEVLTG